MNLHELDEYVANGDASFHWKRIGEAELWFQSQAWRGEPWTHHLTLNGGPETGDCAVLVVTGEDPNELDEEEARRLSDSCALPVATLYNIPNQPLFGDLWEDDLIAFTFVQFLASGEADWPLLFPMVKAVIRAMDALKEFTEGRLQRFIVTGLSKRGWTTWLAGATGDGRIAGIAPMVIDHLNMPKQMRHQLITWGSYSDQIQSYTELELPKELDSSEGQRLNAMVDPYCYRDRINCPILIVNGSNDRYWQVDALKNYWFDLPDPKWASVIPNVEHVLGDKVSKLGVLSGFARAVGQEVPIATPIWNWTHETDVSRLQVLPFDLMKRPRLWRATSANYDFRDSVWEACETLETNRSAECFTALLGELQCAMDGIEFSLTTAVEVVPPSI
jgi:PhoPQ-activated pathogenicity-related protein